MHPQQAQQMFASEYNKRLREAPYPEDLLPGFFNEYKHACLQFASYRSLQLPWEIYKVFVMKVENYTMLEVSCVLNMFADLTPAQLTPLITQNYYDALEQIIQMQDKWKALAQPIEDGVKKKVEIMANPKGMNGRPGKIIGLQ